MSCTKHLSSCPKPTLTQASKTNLWLNCTNLATLTLRYLLRDLWRSHQVPKLSMRKWHWPQPRFARCATELGGRRRRGRRRDVSWWGVSLGLLWWGTQIIAEIGVIQGKITADGQFKQGSRSFKRFYQLYINYYASYFSFDFVAVHVMRLQIFYWWYNC